MWSYGASPELCYILTHGGRMCQVVGGRGRLPYLSFLDHDHMVIMLRYNHTTSAMKQDWRTKIVATQYTML